MPRAPGLPLAPDDFTKDNFYAGLILFAPGMMRFKGPLGYGWEGFGRNQLIVIYCAKNKFRLRGDDLFNVFDMWETKANALLLEAIADYILDHAAPAAGRSPEEQKHYQDIIADSNGSWAIQMVQGSRNRGRQQPQSAQNTSSSGSAQNTSSSGSTQNTSSSGSTQNASSSGSRSRAPAASSQQTTSGNTTYGSIGFVNTFRDEYPRTSQG